MNVELAEEFQADCEVEKLIERLGGTENWTAVSHQFLSFGRKNLSPEVLDYLSSSYDGVLALHWIMKGEEPSLQHDVMARAEGMDCSDLRSMVRDPKCWRDQDPAYIAKVTEGFKGLYK
jgi:hypothetical protein